MNAPRSSCSARPICFGFSFPHHGPYTAFHGLARTLRGPVDVIDASTKWCAFLPARYERRIRRRYLLYYERKLRRFFDGTPRAIHYFFPENTLRHAAGWKTRERLILTLHQPPEEMEAMRANPHLDGFFRGIAAADHIVVQASSQMAYFRERYPGIPVTYIPLGVATGHYRRTRPYPPPGEGTGRKNVILTVGNWMRDYPTWADTVETLADRTDLEFRVIANRQHLDAIRTRFGGTPPRQVRLLHGLSDEALAREYEDASVFYLPLHDAMANDALLEALSLEVPLVLTDLPATRDYAGDEAATYIPRQDAGAAARAILDLLADPERAQRCSAAARRRAVEYFDWQHVANAYRTCYAETAS